MDSDVMASMYAYIVRGGSKDECHYVTDEESSQTFDTIAGEVAAMKAADPGIIFEVPSEIPGTLDPAYRIIQTSGEPSEETPPEAAPPAAEETEDGGGGQAVSTPTEVTTEGRFFAIQDAGDPEPWALVRVMPRGLYERWTSEGWVDMPFFAAYFVGGEPGAREVDQDEAEALKQTVRLANAYALATMRGDDKRIPVGEPRPRKPSAKTDEAFSTEEEP